MIGDRARACGLISMDNLRFTQEPLVFHSYVHEAKTFEHVARLARVKTLIFGLNRLRLGPRVLLDPCSIRTLNGVRVPYQFAHLSTNYGIPRIAWA